MGSNHIPLLTTFRGLAAWWVVCYHFRDALGLQADSALLTFLAHGYLAVDFFFVLSGFVIFLSSHQAFNCISWNAWNRFMLRRLVRIYPLHLVVLCAFLLNPLALHFFSGSSVDAARYDPYYFVASIFLVQNWGYFNELAWNVPAWSISTELAAYLLFPLIVSGVNWLRAGKGVDIALAFALCAAIAALFYVAGVTSLGDGISKLGLPRCVLEFSLGVIAAHLYLNHRQFLALASRWFGVVALVLLATGVMLKLADYVYVPGFFFLSVLFVAARPGKSIPVLAHPVMVYLGEISYSTYLVHYFVKDWVKFLSRTVDGMSFAVYAALVLVSSVVLYNTIEKPGQAWGRRWLSARGPQPAVRVNSQT